MMNFLRGVAKVAVGDVDRDALFAFRSQSVGQKRKIEVDILGRRTPFAPRKADLRRCRWTRRADGRSGWTCHRRRFRPSRTEAGPVRARRCSKISLPFLQLHGAFLVVIDDPVFTLGAPEKLQFFDNLGDGRAVDRIAPVQ